MTTFNLADLFECTADAVPTRLAVVAGEARRTYAELDERSNRVADHLIRQGFAPGEHLAVLAMNRIEWIETMLGAFKARLVPLNVNYRYTSDELAHVLLDGNAVALIVDTAYLPLVETVRDRVPGLRHVIVIDGEDDAVGTPYDRALERASGARIGIERSGDDRYVLYTGGTTGAPKGVVWRAEDLFFAALAGGNPGGAPVTHPEELTERIVEHRQPWLVTSPMMHGNGQWNSLVPVADRPRRGAVDRSPVRCRRGRRPRRSRGCVPARARR